MKAGFWKSDWLLGAIVVIVVLVFSRSSDLIPSLERKAYDLGVVATSRAPLERIAVIAIDEASLENMGRWPWSREILANMTDKLAAAKAKVIGNTVLFSEPQIDPGYQYVTKLLDIASKAEAPAPDIIALLKEAEQKLNTDRALSESFARAGNVLQPMLFNLGLPLGKPDKPLPDYVSRNALPASAGEEALPAQSVKYPIDSIGKSVAAIGHLNQLRDVDGAVRTEPLAVAYYGQLYPSLSVMIAARYLNLATADIKVVPGEGVQLQRLKVGTDPSLLMYSYFYKDRENRPAFAVDSFYDVYQGKIPLDKYRDKIVLIGATAAGLGDAPATPVSASMPPVLTLAHSVSSILQEHFFVSPPWTYWTEMLVVLLIALYVIALLPRLNAGTALTLSSVLFVALLAAHMALMVSMGVWMQLMLPATLLLLGHAALVSKRFIVTERAKVKSDESSAESNRMLGLAYQGQGQLDLAWDKFRQVPLSESLLENLYNLALDFERKRQFNKAESVFRYMHGYNPKFRDLEARLTRAKQLSETVILGGASSHPGGTLQLNAGEKPKFGRFEVQKELGKGAMGVVYLGKDPKIGREVAIKTLALSQEFEADELADVKARFFREAETAGRLSHPNIVTIYDTGEEHDFCYIAMELLKGGDLAPHVKPGNLLPMDKVVSIVARVADALGYAHRQGVVHRDVKPANMMYHADTDTLKVTDFGIARLTDSSKTKTGMVLGTPSYMSPEQLAGKKIEGRSDLFSLAVSLYQMLCGQLPFQGESMAQLMFKIANEPPADIHAFNAEVPPTLIAFLQRALAKNPEERYQTGEEFGGALRAALAARTVGSVDIQL
ncbi:MAG: serine/threonine protein kinase [Betaproteobacteria bacterium RIFCSPLOWO2_12_FULL_65_14]|nr:MAG: serine/threonine protein kinase [Betaproteobacteria bacterium RIFCSPLOWO2_12_FULL_65_14]